MSVAVVYVPCETVELQVRLGYGGALSPMELVLLDAVRAGLTDVGQLTGHLQLGRRIVHDLVYDLWRAGLLTVDRSLNRIVVPPEVADRLDRGAPVPGAEYVREKRELMIDQVTRRVLPAGGPLSPPDPRFALPPGDDPVGLDRVPQSAVLRALDESLKADDHRPPADRSHQPVDSGRRRKVLSYRLPPPGLERPRTRRWIELKVEPRWDEHDQQLTMTVVDDRVPAELRESASERLTQLAAEAPGGKPFTALRDVAVGALSEPPSPAGALARLADRVETARGVPAGQRRAWHRELADGARQLEGLLQERTDREMRVRPVTADEHERLVGELIAQADAQLVICSPRIHYQTLRRHLPALEDAVRRDVRLVLLWGAADRDRDEEFDERTRNALEDLQRLGAKAGATQVVLPVTSARTHAKLVIADHTAALVTSAAPLSGAGGRSSVGLLLEQPGDDSPVITELLDWVRASVPSYEHSRLVRVRAADFRTADPGTAGAPAPEPARGRGRGELPEPAVEAPAEDPSVETSALELWVGGWSAYLRQAQARLAARRLPAARLVTDATHRTLFRVALRRARRRLVIASDGLAAEIVDTGLVGALRSRLEEGVEVTLVLPDAGHPVGDRRQYGEARQRLQDLLARFPGGLRLVEGGNRAALLVWDDEAVVGSFNYLAFDGRYGRHRLASELSVRVSGAAAADSVARAAGATGTPAAPEAAAGTGPETGPGSAAAPTPAGVAHAPAQRLLRAYAEQGAADPRLVAKVLGDAEDPWQLLELLGGSGPEDLVAVVAARCLADHRGGGPDGGQDARAGRWQRWLVRHCWNTGRFVEAAVLRLGLPEAGFRPRARTAVLGAARSAHRPAAVAAVLEELVLEELVLPEGLCAAERVVAALGACSLLLLTGDASGQEALEVVRPRLAAPWSEFADRVGAYWRAAYLPMPLELIRVSLDGSRREHERAGLWEELEHRLAHARAMTFASPVSTRTHHALFNTPSGAFAELGRIVTGRGDGELREWREGPGAHPAEQLVLAAGRGASQHGTPMFGGHLKRYLQRLNPVVTAVDDLLGTAGSAAATGAAPPGAEELGTWLAGHWAGLTGAAAALDGPEGVLARRFLADLEPLARWRAS
ncbi:hypothetical protein KBZ10_13785 [Streptomyces sp. F63]|uniref:hypothetical protein n=1 Tax=Streptomyces sp. F63 TaxID=2824887 RepID=UPI001B38336D|nr:hypothetical protein [Streptomyces sp. F63]MBQ0985564.1 hypothetical protein [Streptomyces sp. F63]